MNRITHSIFKRALISMRGAILIAPVCLGFLLVCPRAHAEGQYIEAAVENSYHSKEKFKIPHQYKPEIHDGFFRIIVDYPSMRPTLGRRVPPIGSNSLDIVVKAYPPNGTLGEEIVKGTYGAELVDRYDGYAVYSKPLGTLGPPKAIVFDDAYGNHIAVEIMGDWSVRDEIMHGIRPNYLIRFSFSKSLRADFRSIDSMVSKLIAAMHVASAS